MEIGFRNPLYTELSRYQPLSLLVLKRHISSWLGGELSQSIPKIISLVLFLCS